MKHKKIISIILIFIFAFSLCNGNIGTLNQVSASEAVQRIYGSTRYETSFAVADEMKLNLNIDKFSSVIVADGTNYPDALAGSCLSAEINAPILMVDTNNSYAMQSLVDYVNNNLSPEGTVYILGGTNAVSDELVAMLSAFTIERIFGENRYETNLEILKKISIEDKPILICTGNNFADSLSASATGFPILLVNEELTASQQDFLSDYITNPIYILGGTAAVNESIESTLISCGSAVNRIYGNTRYETSIQIANSFFSDSTSAIIAYAWNFPDGLSGGPLAHTKQTPLILTGANMDITPDKSAEQSAAAFAMNYTAEKSIYSGIALGGEAVLTDYTLNLVFHIPIIEDNEDAADIEDKIVVLDPGHGAAGTGAYRNWKTFIIDEAVINYKLSQYTKAYLENNYDDVIVYITKSKLAENPNLSTRVNFGVEKSADVFVSQHVNSTGEQLTTANGVYALVPTVDTSHSYNKDVALESQKLGRFILEQLELLGWKNNGYKFRLSSDNTKYPDGSLADYYGIVKKCRESQIPGLIIEHGFCNNLYDAQKLADEEMLQKTAQADAIGIANYLGLLENDSPTSDEYIDLVISLE